jgi:hypothetical protein
MKTVKIQFYGNNSDEFAQKFYTFLLDGGLEDYIIDNISDQDSSLEIEDFDNEKMKVIFKCFENSKEVTKNEKFVDITKFNDESIEVYITSKNPKYKDEDKKAVLGNYDSGECIRIDLASGTNIYIGYDNTIRIVYANDSVNEIYDDNPKYSETETPERTIGFYNLKKGIKVKIVYFRK